MSDLSEMRKRARKAVEKRLAEKGYRRRGGGRVGVEKIPEAEKIPEGARQVTFKDVSGKVVRAPLEKGLTSREVMERHNQKLVEEAAKKRQELIKEAQRREATRRVGSITKVTTDPKKGEVTYHGSKGKYTFPKEGLRFTRREKGTRKPVEEEMEAGSPEARQALLLKAVAQKSPEGKFKELAKRRAIEAEEKLTKPERAKARLGSAYVRGEVSPTYYYFEPATARTIPGLPETERPIFDVPGPRTRVKRFAELTEAEKREVLKGESALGGLYGITTRVTDSPDIRPTSRLPSSQILAKEEAFEERVKKLTEKEKKFFTSPYFKATEKVASFITLGFDKPREERGWLGQYAQLGVGAVLAAPLAISGTVYFAGGKLAAGAEAVTRFPETRKQVAKEFIIGTPRRVFETGTYDPREPSGAITWTFALVGGGIRALKTTRGPTVETKLDIETHTYKTPEVTVEKTAPTKKVGTIETLEIQAGEIIVKKEGPLLFEYPRQKVLEKAVGRQAPTVAVSKGVLKQGSLTYDLTSVQVGRKVYGALEGKYQDILFKKGETGGIQLKYLTKAGKVKGVKKVPYQPEDIALKKTLFTRAGKKQQFDIGEKVGEEVFYDLRTTQREGFYRAFGTKEEFVKGRDIKKKFLGKAKTTLLQTDKAAPQKGVVQIGKDLSITLTRADVKYALQPKYKPDTKAFLYETKTEGIIPVTEYVKQPQLITKRTTKFDSRTRYAFEKSRAKPLKRVGKAMQEMGKKGEILTKKRVLIETVEPKVKPQKPSVKIHLTGEEAISMLKGREVVSPKIPIAVTERKPFVKTKTEVKPLTRTEIPTQTKAYEKLKTDIKIHTKTKVPIKTRARAITKTEAKAQSRTEAKARTRTTTVTKTKVATKTPTTAVTTTPTILTPPQTPTPTPPPPFLGAIPSRKRKKKQPGYHAYVKRKQFKKGKGSYLSRGYKKVNKKTLTEKGAKVKAGEIVDKYANRSFLVKEAKQPAKESYKDSKWDSLSKKFRKKKKQPNVFVEKSKYAIDSGMERRQIPFEAARQKRSQRKSRGIFDFKRKKKSIFSFGG